MVPRSATRFLRLALRASSANAEVAVALRGVGRQLRCSRGREAPEAARGFEPNALHAVAAAVANEAIAPLSILQPYMQ